MISETQLRGQITRLCNQTSQAEVARNLKITRAYISDIIAGKRRISNRIANAFGYRVTGKSVPIERQYELIFKEL